MSEEIEREMVTVQISRVLVDQLADWSEPVQMKVVPVGDGFEIMTRVVGVSE